MLCTFKSASSITPSYLGLTSRGTKPKPLFCTSWLFTTSLFTVSFFLNKSNNLYNYLSLACNIYKTLKKDGILLVRGVDKLDCWALKRMFGRGQAYNDVKPISLIDYESILDAGFKDVELIPLHVVEYYKTKEDLLALLKKTPILDDFSENLNGEYERRIIDKDLLKIGLF